MKRAPEWSVGMERRLPAPPDVVFRYFVDPELYRRWKGIDAELDPRPGGTYRVRMRPEVWVRGEYLVVDPPHRLVMTWGFERTSGLPKVMEEVPPASSRVEFTFLPEGADTIVRVRHTALPSEPAQQLHELGWVNYLGRLDIVVAGGDPGEDPMIAAGETVFRTS